MEQGIQPVSEYGASAPGEVRVRRALLSVSDKTGIVEFARGLADLGVEIVSTGGTAGALEDAGITVRSITDLTGFPEIMDGRVKTLHPKLYAGLLAVRDNPEHMQAAEEQEVEFVDLVCVNLYPFERTAAQRGVLDQEVIENIDIGGPTMIRAAAKNSDFAAVLTDPADYAPVLAELRDSGGRLSLETRRRLAAGAFATTARYDAAIATWFAIRESGEEELPVTFAESFEKVTSATARTRTSVRPSTRALERRPTCSGASSSSTARSSRSTTCSTSPRRASSSRSSTSPPVRSSSTTTPAAARSATTSARPTSAPSRATRRAPTAV
jgi:phosphoribosylaminoimidazolecarboxamide formyltransferase/IMP cyclohydrolase